MRQIQRKESLTNDIIDTELWQSEQQMHEYLATQSTTKKKFDAVKIQICFRREVLHQHMEGDKGFTFTTAVPNSTRRLDIQDNLGLHKTTTVSTRRGWLLQEKEEKGQKYSLTSTCIIINITSKIT